MSDLIHIEKNSVQETLIIPLCARVQCTELFPELYSDPESVRALERLDYDDSEAKKNLGFMVRFGALEAAMRQCDIAFEIRAYLKEHPKAAVVNLGCGLDPMSRNLDNGTCRLYNIDLPDVIAVRNEIFPAGEREVNLAADLNDSAWFEQIDASEGAFFFACGVFYYFTQEDAKALILAMNQAFPGGRLVFDTCGALALKVMMKGIVQKAGIRDVSAYFHAGRPDRDIAPWADGMDLSARGYMLGYQDLKVKSVPGSFRLLAKVCDGIMQMKIIRLDFGV